MNFKDRLYVAGFSENYKEAISEFGLGLEINQTCVSEMLDPERREELLAKIQEEIAACGAEKVILHGPFTEIHPAAIDHRAKELGLERLNAAYEVCKALGVKKMVVHSGWVPFIYFKKYQAERGAEFWQEFMKDKPEDFEIAIENVLDDEPYMIAEILGRIGDPRVGACLDVGHANCASRKGINILEWIAVLGPRIKHIHLHNNDGTGDSHNDIDKGSLDVYKTMMGISVYCRPDVTLTIESHEALASVKYLKENGYI